MSARHVDLTGLAHYNAGITRSRADYEAHPTAFTGRDICPSCVWPKTRQNCPHCRGVASDKARHARKKAAA